MKVLKIVASLLFLLVAVLHLGGVSAKRQDPEAVQQDLLRRLAVRENRPTPLPLCMKNRQTWPGTLRNHALLYEGRNALLCAGTRCCCCVFVSVCVGACAL